MFANNTQYRISVIGHLQEKTSEEADDTLQASIVSWISLLVYHNS